MTGSAIRVDDLGKRYVIAHESAATYTALRDVVSRHARRMIRSVADMARGRQLLEGDVREEYWALRDVSFDVPEGQVLGVIGRNGAGKSTLLKILSRITEPTTGRVAIAGRVASLLEVGTGFHPELSGRENIYLNGAILGMGRSEIRRKFDEIVAFAEIERFLDTPVKRYSSGMYVRLAFAVAAHLEPEILVVDEVLAVGDAEFQRKCLGKMKSVGASGRTVLFVSHNMAAIRSLTTRSLWLDSGRIRFDGPSEHVIDAYLGSASRSAEPVAERLPGAGRNTRILSAALLDAAGAPARIYRSGAPLIVEIAFETNGARGMSLDLVLRDQSRSKLALASLHHFQNATLPTAPGRYRCRIRLAPMHLASGAYALDVATAVANDAWDHYVEDAIPFDVDYCNPGVGSWNFQQGFGYGALAMPILDSVSFEPEHERDAAHA